MLNKYIFFLIISFLQIANISDIKQGNHLATLEIRKINLIKNLYPIESKENDVDINLELLKTTDPNNNYYVIAGHNGNTPNSYFNKLEYLSINDELNIYYNNKKYTYLLLEIYEINKNGYIELPKDINKVILITCKKNNDYLQIVYTFKIDNIDK